MARLCEVIRNEKQEQNKISFSPKQEIYICHKQTHRKRTRMQLCNVRDKIDKQAAQTSSRILCFLASVAGFYTWFIHKLWKSTQMKNNIIVKLQ